MKRIVLTAELLAVALLFAACQAPQKSEPAPTPQTKETPQTAEQPPVAEKPQTAEKPAPQQPLPPADTPEGRYAREIDRLIPKLADENPESRAAARREFEVMCNTAATPGSETERVALCGQIALRLGLSTPQAARVWMIRQLEKIGNGEVVPALTGLLQDEDALVNETARRALQFNPSGNVRGVIEAALAEAPDDERRVAMINALGARREQESAPVLMKYLDNESVAVAAAAVAALSEIGVPVAQAAIYRAWLNDKSPIRNQAEIALLRCAEQLLEAGNDRAAARLYQDIYDRCRNDASYFAALEGLARSKGPGALIMLTEHMKMADPETALRAARIALEIPGEPTVMTLSIMIGEMPTEIQAVLIEGLGNFKNDIARPTIVSAAESDVSELRVAALRALRVMGNGGDLALIASIAGKTTGAEREEARRTLALMPGADIDETIVGLVRESEAASAPARAELARACAARHYAPAVEALLQALDDPDEGVQTVAYESLAVLMTPDMLPKVVVHLLADLSDPLRETAENTIVTVAMRDPDAKSRSAPVLQILQNVQGAKRASLIRVAGRIGGERALQMIRSQYPNPEPEIADAAARALANWSDASVLQDLLMIAQHGTDEAHRVLALRGYVRLVRLPSDRTVHGTYKLLDQAMSIATRAEDKKLVLSALSELSSVDALMLAEMSLNSEELRDEAALAMMSIAKSLSADQPDAALAAVEKARGVALGEAAKKQVEEAAQFVSHFSGYCTKWLIAGPFVDPGKDAAQLFEIAFAPESEAKPSDWKPIEPTDNAKPWIYDLTKIVGGDNRCVYLKTKVWAEQAGKVRLEIGSDDGVKAWLNGKLVHSNMKIRPVSPAEDKAEVELNQGWNNLLLKVVQGSGGWGFAVGFTAPDGSRLPGVRYER